MIVVVSLAFASAVGVLGYMVLANIRDSDASWLHDRTSRNKNRWWGCE